MDIRTEILPPYYHPSYAVRARRERALAIRDFARWVGGLFDCLFIGRS